MYSDLELLEIAKEVALSAGQKAVANYANSQKYEFDTINPLEVKAEIDVLIEKFIIKGLGKTLLPILSEESGWNGLWERSGRYWVIDPIDGTFNYVRRVGPSAVSIALWGKKKPVFGVIFSISEQKLYWGGKTFNSYCDGNRISVSNVSSPRHAALCTGFPVRQNKKKVGSGHWFWNLIMTFSKIRMIGSASMSLVLLSNGSVEAYVEDNIMVWDVAAGLAIVEGAGGSIRLIDRDAKCCLAVVASNGKLDDFVVNI